MTRLDLAALVKRGHAETPVISLPLRCQCGSTDCRVLIGGSNTYSSQP